MTILQPGDRAQAGRGDRPDVTIAAVPPGRRSSPGRLGGVVALALVVLAWTLPPETCRPYTLHLWDDYIEQPGTLILHSIGNRTLGQAQTDYNLAPGKPEPGPWVCVIAWQVTALDDAGQPLPPECQPGGFTVDGQQWDGI